MNEKLKELEVKAVEQLLTKLEEMLNDIRDGRPLFGNCRHAHLSEIVKVCHQIRSLLPGEK